MLSWYCGQPFVLCAAARRDCLLLSARRRGTFFCVAKRKYPKKRRPGAARNPVPNGPPQAPPNSSLANGSGLKQIGVLRVRIFDSLSTTLGQTVWPGSRQRGRVASLQPNVYRAPQGWPHAVTVLRPTFFCFVVSLRGMLFCCFHPAGVMIYAKFRYDAAG